MITVLLVVIILLVVTAVHEAGHGLAIRWKGGRMERVSIGRGPRLWISRSSRIELRLLPFGGRIEGSGLLPGTPRAVVAVGGPLSNLIFACAAFTFALATPGMEVFLFSEGDEGRLAGVAREVGGWIWIVPGAVEEIVRSGSAGELTRGLRGLVEVLRSGGWPAVPYVLGATSAAWAALNLIPIPVANTDGWVLVRALWGAFRGEGPSHATGL